MSNTTNTFNHWNNNNWNHGGWYHGNWHGNWAQGGAYPPIGWGGGYGNRGYGWGWGLGGLGMGLALGAMSPWNWGYYNYSNPYWNGGGAGYTGYNYGQPLAYASAPGGAMANTDPNQAANNPAIATFDQARGAFMQGDYQTALALDEQAIAQMPSDPVLHEFRGLCEFAMGNYQQAAATDYAVLSQGPGMDWTTVIGLYPNVDAYTNQLRALESYCGMNPNATDASFVLAYQYMIQGANDAAAGQLREIVRKQPQNQLASQLLTSISPSAPPPTAPPPPMTAPSAANLVGNWNANQPDGTKIALKLGPDQQFDWQVNHSGQTQNMRGNYTLADNILVLKSGDNNSLVGQVGMVADNRMNFRLTGENPADPGLTFVR